MMKVLRWGACILPSCVALAACSDDGRDAYPYPPGRSIVIGAAIGDDDDFGRSRAGVLPFGRYATPEADGCIEWRGKGGKKGAEVECLRPQEDCGRGGTADVIVDADGDVLAVICYPNRDYDVLVIPDGPVASPVLGNNSVIVLDGEDDGADIEGDLLIEGNNVIVYGAGPDRSVLGGSLQIDKNNAIVRGVRIEGDVWITKNNASIIDCVIEGDLTVSGNNVNLALCEVWGRISVEGNNAVLVSNLIAGDHVVSGKNLRCNDNFRFSDPDRDGWVDDEDVLGPVTCDF